MKFSTGLILASAAGAHAQQFKGLDKSSLSPGCFYETFDTTDLEKAGWQVSTGLKEGRISYNGVWKIEEPHRYPGYPGDMGLVMTTEADFYSIYKRLPEPVTTENQDLVFQYEVKYQDGIECGGAYFKLISDDTFDAAKFSDQVRYEVMFGPDICGSDNKIQFIYTKDTHNDTIHSELRTAPMARKSELSTLYTLIIRSNLEVEIRVNGETAKKGHMINTAHFMQPPLSVPQYIPDTSVVKPQDWDDRPVILDLTATKPDGWDEQYGRETIPDPSAQKPVGWNDDISVLPQIPDPKISKPELWDDAEDGEWEAPLIDNPECVLGCGEWKAPEIPNPEYKGKWRPPYIMNPNYKGDWKPPMIENPDFTEQQKSVVKPITGIGMEAWSMQSGVLFNNLYLGNSVGDAERLGNETFLPKLNLEHENFKATAPKPRHAPQAPPATFEDLLQDKSALTNLKESITNSVAREHALAKGFWIQFKMSPNEAVASDPFRFAVYCFGFLITFVFTFGFINVTMFIILTKRDAEKESERKKNLEKSVKQVKEDLKEVKEDLNEVKEDGDKFTIHVEAPSSDSEDIAETEGTSGVKVNDTTTERRR